MKYKSFLYTIRLYTHTSIHHCLNYGDNERAMTMLNRVGVIINGVTSVQRRFCRVF